MSPSSKKRWLQARVTYGTWRARGCTSYTAFVTTRERLVRDAEPLLCMVRAIQRTQQWLYARSAQEMPRPFPRSSQRSTSACWPPPSPTTKRSRYGDVIRFFPKTALIVCGDPSYPGGSSVGRCHTLLASITAQRCAFCPNRFCARRRRTLLIVGPASKAIRDLFAARRPLPNQTS